MGTFRVEPEVFERIPNLRIAVAVAPSGNLDNEAPRPEVERFWRSAWNDAAAAAAYGNAQSHPRVKPWREAFTRMGVSGKQYPSSVEALLRRALKGGEPFTINPLVDYYNAVSLHYIVPTGAFDLDDLQDVFELRLSEPGDTFQALDDAEPIDVPPGEVSYATGPTIITRHIVWRQSRAGLVTPSTRRAVFVSEVLAELGPGAPRRSPPSCSAACATASARLPLLQSSCRTDRASRGRTRFVRPL
jgi:DNA/RNA-binding domain of Phe-tRNA-synthetase-like protein